MGSLMIGSGIGSVFRVGIAPRLSVAAVPFDGSWPVLLACGGVAALCLLLWSQAGQRFFLWTMIAAIGVGVAAGLADWLVVSDREQIEALFPRLARAAESGDAATILAALDPQSVPVRAEAERALRDFHPEEVRITRLEVEIPSGPAPPRARADMLVHVRGDARLAGSTGPVATLVDLSVDLRKFDGRWLITDFEAEPGRPIDRR